MDKRKKSIFTTKFFLTVGVFAFLFFSTAYKGSVAFADSGQSLLTPALVHARAETKITTKYGRVMGFWDDNNTWAWKGIPYAKPPVGALRWKAPEDPDPWKGVKQMVDDCVECTQWAAAENLQRLDYVIGSEDCLYLNIWRPRSNEKNLPVYFWIHGGSNNTGSAKAYNGSALASRSNMVVVVIQYRLGPFGWFTNPALKTGDPKGDSGNFGTLDHLKALKWVRENIEAFGGNPDNITIAGQSAGAHNVMNLLISPLAKGLFHKAMSQSNGQSTLSIGVGENAANTKIKSLLAADGYSWEVNWKEWSLIDQEDYLRGKDPSELMKASLDPATDSMTLHSAYEDGVVIPCGGLSSTIQSGNYNKVPIILGSNEYEMKLLLPSFGYMIKAIYPGIPSSPFTWAQLFEVLDGNLSLDDVLPTSFDKYLYESCGYYGSCMWKAKYVDSIARQLKKQQDHVYVYLFKWGGKGSGPEPFDFILGPAHGMELPFFGGMDESLLGYSFTEENRPGREALQTAMMAYVAQFVRTGEPNKADSDLLAWEGWSNGVGESKAIIFDADKNNALLSMTNQELTVLKVQSGITTWLLSPPIDPRKNVIFMSIW